MLELSILIKSARENHGITQVDLARRAGVSLPTLQKIEAGQANPTIGIAEKILESLSFKIELKPIPVDWDRLSAYGAALTTFRETKKIIYSQEELLHLIYAGANEIQHRTVFGDQERKKEALQGLLLAIKTHYPSFFKRYFSKSKRITDFIDQKKITGKILKLRRYSLSYLAQYL